MPEPPQVRAAAGDGEEALLIAHLAAAAAGGAGYWRLTGRDAAAFAWLTLFVAPNFHLLGDAENRFLEFQRNVFAKIGAALRPRAAAAAPASEHIAEAEDVAKDVVEVVKDGGVEAAEPAPRRFLRRHVRSGRSERVSPVGQNGVGFAALLEALFASGIIGIAVGMVLQGKLAIRALDLLIVGGTRDA